MASPCFPRAGRTPFLGGRVNPVCEPFVVPVTPALIAGWTGPAKQRLGDDPIPNPPIVVIAEGCGFYVYPELKLCDVCDGGAVYLSTRRAEVRDLLARRMPVFRWIATAEMSEAIDAKVAAALWWCAAHSSAADRPFTKALMPWRNVGPAGQKPNTTQWERASLSFRGAPAQVFNVPYRGEGAAQRRADEQLLTERVALIDADRVRLPMLWGVVTIELEGTP